MVLKKGKGTEGKIGCDGMAGNFYEGVLQQGIPWIKETIKRSGQSSTESTIAVR